MFVCLFLLSGFGKQINEYLNSCRIKREAEKRVGENPPNNLDPLICYKRPGKTWSFILCDKNWSSPIWEFGWNFWIIVYRKIQYGAMQSIPDDTWRPVFFSLGGNSAAVSKSIETFKKMEIDFQDTNSRRSSNSSVYWHQREKTKFDWWPALPVLWCWTDSLRGNTCAAHQRCWQGWSDSDGRERAAAFCGRPKRGLYIQRKGEKACRFLFKLFKPELIWFFQMSYRHRMTGENTVKDRELPERRELDPQAATTADDLIL